MLPRWSDLARSRICIAYCMCLDKYTRDRSATFGSASWRMARHLSTYQVRPNHYQLYKGPKKRQPQRKLRRTPTSSRTSVHAWASICHTKTESLSACTPAPQVVSQRGESLGPSMRGRPRLCRRSQFDSHRTEAAAPDAAPPWRRPRRQVSALRAHAALALACTRVCTCVGSQREAQDALGSSG